MAQSLEGEAGEVPEGGVLVGGPGGGVMMAVGAKVDLGLKGQSVGAGDWEGFLVVWV